MSCQLVVGHVKQICPCFIPPYSKFIFRTASIHIFHLKCWHLQLQKSFFLQKYLFLSIQQQTSKPVINPSSASKEGLTNRGVKDSPLSEASIHPAYCCILLLHTTKTWHLDAPPNILPPSSSPVMPSFPTAYRRQHFEKPRQVWTFSGKFYAQLLVASQHQVALPFGEEEGLPRSLRISRKWPESRFDFLELENSAGALKSQRRRLARAWLGGSTQHQRCKNRQMWQMK